MGQTYWSTILRNLNRIIGLTVGATLGVIAGALIACSDGCSFNDVIKAAKVGSIVGASLTVMCWIIEICLLGLLHMIAVPSKVAWVAEWMKLGRPGTQPLPLPINGR